MTTETNVASEHVEMEYAGFWWRVFASVVDSVVFLLIDGFIGRAVYGPYYSFFAYYGASFYEPFVGPADFMLNILLPFVVTILFWLQCGATPGKMVIGARIVDAKTGRLPTFGQCIGRYLAYILSAIPLCLGFIWVAFDKRKRGWHDMLAGTVVVRKKARFQAVSFKNSPKEV